MKKLFNLRLLLLIPLVYLFVLQYRNSHTWSLLFNIGITLIFAVLVFIYLFILYKSSNETNKNNIIVKVGLIFCIAFSIVFLRPYAEDDVLDYKFNSYSTVENTVAGKTTEYTVKEIKYTQYQTVELVTVEHNIRKYIPESINCGYCEYNVVDMIEQDGHYFFAIYLIDKSSYLEKNITSRFIVELDSDFEVIKSVPITLEEGTYFNSIKLIQSDSDKIYYSLYLCKNNTDDTCDTSKIYSIDENNNVTDHFMIENSRVLSGLVKDETLYTMKHPEESDEITIQKHSLNGKFLQEKLIESSSIVVNQSMFIEDDIIYLSVSDYSLSSLYRLDLNLQYVEDIILYPYDPSLNRHYLMSAKVYNIDKNKFKYFINSTYHHYTVNKTGDKVYLGNKDNIYYQVNDDSGDVNILKYKNLITNPTIIILSFLFLFTFICDIFRNYRVKIKFPKDKNHISVRDYYEPFTYLNREEK